MTTKNELLQSFIKNYENLVDQKEKEDEETSNYIFLSGQIYTLGRSIEKLKQFVHEEYSKQFHQHFKIEIELTGTQMVKNILEPKDLSAMQPLSEVEYLTLYDIEEGQEVLTLADTPSYQNILKQWFDLFVAADGQKEEFLVRLEETEHLYK